MNTSHRFSIIMAVATMLIATAVASAQTLDLFFEQPFPYTTSSNPPYAIFADKPYCYVTEVPSDDESNGFCLVTVNPDIRCYYYETESISPSLVYKISQQGELLGELTIGYDDRYAFVYAVYLSPDDSQCFLAVGQVHDNDLHYDKPFMAKFDQNLNLLWRREVELPEPYRNYISFGSVMDAEGNIFCSSYLYSCDVGSSFSRFIFRLTPEGVLDSINELPLVSYFQKVFEYPDGSGDYGLLEYVVQENQLDNQLILLRVNSDLEIIGQQVLPEEYREMDPTNTYATLFFRLWNPNSSTSSRHAAALLPDGNLVLANEAGVTIQDKYESYVGFGLLWVNPNGEAVSCVMDWCDTEHDSLVMATPTLPLCDDGFYFVYAMGQNSGYDYMNCFVVGKMDWQNNLLWRRYWNRYLPEYGMKIYYPQDAIASHDGGCLISGFSFESNINAGSSYVYKPDVFLLKFFADGTLAIPEMEPSIRPYAFFPNPVDDFLRLEFSPDVTPSIVELYDIQGQLVRSQGNSLESINMKELPSGTYTLHIVMNDGTSYSDKVVKQ